MFDLVIQLAVFAGIAFFGARGLGGVTVRGGWTSLVIAILFSVLSALLGVPVRAYYLSYPSFHKRDGPRTRRDPKPNLFVSRNPKRVHPPWGP